MLRRLGVRGGLRQVLTLVTGAAAVQVLVLATRPLLTRLYSVEAFGVLGVFVAPAYLFATVGTLRYEDAVALPASQREGAGLAVLAGLAALVVAGALALAAPARVALAAAMGTPEVAPLLPLLPAVVGVLGVANAAQAWLARADAYRAISAGMVAQSLVVVGVQLAGTGLGAGGLVLGTVLGAVCFAVVLVAAALRAGAADGLRQSDLVGLARRYRRFPAFGLPASGLVQLAARLPPVALAVAFGPTVIGWFAVAVASVSVPVGLLGDAVGQVFVVRGAQAAREGRLGPLVERVHRRLVAAVAFPVLAVALLGPDLFAVVFGEPWRQAGVYARVLSPWLLLSAVGAPLTRVFDVTERQRDELATGLVTAVLVGGALAVGAWLDEPLAALAALAVGGTAARVVQIAWAFGLSGASRLRGVRDLAAAVAASAAWLVPSALGVAWLGVWGGVGGAAVGAVGYAVTVVGRGMADEAG